MEFLNAGKDFLTEAFIPRFQLDSIHFYTARKTDTEVKQKQI